VKIIIVEYDPHWPEQFADLSSQLSKVVGELVLAIEHVGSTSVPGLAAKPIIDLDLVVAPDHVEQAIRRLAKGGYEHRGDLGIEGREAFWQPPHRIPHHLYLCPDGSLGLRNHLAVRNFLRAHPEKAQEYGHMKMKLAREFPDDINSYINGKTDFLLRILRQSPLSTDDLRKIQEANRS